MELRAKVPYHTSFGSLFPGDSTEGKDLPEEKKQQMLADFPGWFDLIEEEKKAEPAAPTSEEHAPPARKRGRN